MNIYKKESIKTITLRLVSLKTNRKLFNNLTKDKIINSPQSINKLVLIQNSTNSLYNNKTRNISEYIMTCSLTFLKIPFLDQLF